MKTVLDYTKKEWEKLEYSEKAGIIAKQDSIILSLFIPMLEKAGIKYVTVTYEGAGDSGEAMDVEAFLKHEHFEDRGKNGGWNTSLTDDQRKVYQVIESKNRKKLVNLEKKFNKGFDIKTRDWQGDLVKKSLNIRDALVDMVDYDWYNNDGGCGTVILNVKDNTVIVDGEQYYSDSHNVYEEYKLKDVVFN